MWRGERWASDLDEAKLLNSQIERLHQRFDEIVTEALRR
jgi:hypothetical protein